MQRFPFKLQRLMEYRKLSQEQAQAEFAKATSVFLHEKDKLSELLNDCIIIDINPSIKKNAITHRVKNKLKLPDASIAATAQYLSLPLLTADKDFKKINKIDVLLYEK